MSAARYVWKQVALNASKPGPISRSSHAISSIGNKVFLLGGEHVARTPIDSTVYEFTADRDTWDVVEVVSGEAPSHRIAHGQAVIGSKIYVFGGRQGIHMDEKPLNDLHCFDTSTRVWSGSIPYISGEPPSARSFHKMVSVGDMLYVFGGCAADGRQKDIHSFNTLTGVWAALEKSLDIAGRGGPSFAAVNTGTIVDGTTSDSLMVTAGFSGQENNDMHMYNIASDSWSPSVTLPYRARSVCPTTTISKGKYVLLFGGEVNISDRGHEGAGDFSNDIVCIDSATGTILKCTNITEGSDASKCPPARGWTEMATLGSKSNSSSILTLSGSHCESAHSVLLFGGLTGNDENPQRLGDTWLLTIVIDDK